MELNTLLIELAEREGSDLHLVAGQPPVFRIAARVMRTRKIAKKATTVSLLRASSQAKRTVVSADNCR